jgi:L-cysteine S-thiosulfotransferase
MRKSANSMLSALATGLLAAALVGSAMAADAAKEEETGKDLAYSNKKGNCLACHAMPTQPDAEAAGNIGPPLIAMSARYPDRAKLRAQIWNATAANPQTSMPPFGKHKILTEEEIDKITDFIHGL